MNESTSARTILDPRDGIDLIVFAVGHNGLTASCYLNQAVSLDWRAS